MPEDIRSTEAMATAEDVAHDQPRFSRPELVAGARVLPIVPRTIDEVFRVAQAVLVANIVPDNLAKEQGRLLPEKEVVSKLVAVIMAGAEVGMGPMSSLANIAIINKRRSIWGQGAVALLQQSGLLEDMRVEAVGVTPSADAPTAKYTDDYGIRVTLKRRGQPTAYVGEYTVGRAKRAHLWMNASKRPWIEHPDRQMQWRAFHIAATDGFSDCLNGMMVREVAEDLVHELPPQTDASFLDDVSTANGQASLSAPTEQPVQASNPIHDEKTPAEPVEARVVVGMTTTTHDTETVRSAPAPQPTTPNPSHGSDRPGGNTPCDPPDPLRGVTPAEWWTEAARSGNYTVKVATPLASAGRDQLCALIGDAPDQAALLQFQAVNSRQISSIDLASKAAAKAVRQAIDDRLDALNNTKSPDNVTKEERA